MRNIERHDGTLIPKTSDIRSVYECHTLSKTRSVDKGISRLIIAQRISTILHADQIVVLKDGEIVGLGTHDELMETCEVYRAIAESQMKGGE